MACDISLLKNGRIYLCVDLKSFYASVECVERHLDPLTTNLAVADPERTDKTICLAISPSMKALGIKNRCRVFEIPAGTPYIIAPPRMKLYIKYSARIYGIYLKYVAKEDIHVYSVDEAFLDVTDYLSMYQTDARSLAQRILQDVGQMMDELSDVRQVPQGMLRIISRKQKRCTKGRGRSRRQGERSLTEMEKSLRPIKRCAPYLLSIVR